MSPARPKTIFICEDDQGILEVIKIILEAEGYTIESYSSGRNLEQAAVKTRPALLLLDLWMPEMNGPEFIKRLRGNARTKDIPVVLVSAATDLEQIANRSGVPFLKKPFHIDDLLLVVKRECRIS